MKKMQRAAILAQWLLIVAAGCTSSEPVPDPATTISPSPNKGYKVLLTVPDPPGQLHVTAHITYVIDNNHDCVPLDKTRAIGGIHPSFHRTVNAPVTVLGNGRYELTFHDDAIKSEDYYGMGPCNWKGAAAFTLDWDRYSARAAAQTLETDVVFSISCRTEPGNPVTACLGSEHVRHSYEQRFNLEILTTRMQ